MVLLIKISFKLFKTICNNINNVLYIFQESLLLVNTSKFFKGHGITIK